MLRASVLILSLVVANSLRKVVFVFYLYFIPFISSDDTEADELLDGAESQNYGYGYGTKVTDISLSLSLPFPPLYVVNSFYLKGTDFPL